MPGDQRCPRWAGWTSRAPPLSGGGVESLTVADAEPAHPLVSSYHHHCIPCSFSICHTTTRPPRPSRLSRARWPNLGRNLRIISGSQIRWIFVFFVNSTGTAQKTICPLVNVGKFTFLLGVFLNQSTGMPLTSVAQTIPTPPEEQWFLKVRETFVSKYHFEKSQTNKMGAKLSCLCLTQIIIVMLCLSLKLYRYIY